LTFRFAFGNSLVWIASIFAAALHGLFFCSFAFVYNLPFASVESERICLFSSLRSTFMPLTSYLIPSVSPLDLGCGKSIEGETE